MPTGRTEPSTDPTRRCWRCLEQFAEQPGEISRPDEWWVCDACAALLLPDRGVRS